MGKQQVIILPSYDRCQLTSENTWKSQCMKKHSTKFSLKVTQSFLTLRPHDLYSPWDSPGQNTEVGSLSLLQGIFPAQEPNWGLLHCRWILYQLSYRGSPKHKLIPVF